MAAPTDSTDAIKLRLREAGISPTRQRVQIAGVVLERDQHLSAEQVLHRVNGERSRVSKATVYNTLNLFARRGLVREVIVDPSKVFYDSNAAEHHHVYNIDSGELTDIPGSTAQLAGLPELPEGTVPVGVDVVIRVRSAD